VLTSSASSSETCGGVGGGEEATELAGPEDIEKGVSDRRDGLDDIVQPS
jgi:hypothetical protein